MKNDYDLFRHMSDTYQLTLTGSAMHEIRVAAGLLDLERENARLWSEIYLWVTTRKLRTRLISGM